MKPCQEKLDPCATSLKHVKTGYARVRSLDRRASFPSVILNRLHFTFARACVQVKKPLTSFLKQVRSVAILHALSDEHRKSSIIVDGGTFRGKL